MKSILIIILLFSIKIYSQYDEKNFSIGLNFIYTTDARIFLNPNSSDIIERNSEFDLSDIMSPGINFRYKALDEVLLDLNVEYLHRTASGNNEKVIINQRITDITVKDGFKMIPVEFSVLYLLPFSTEKFKFLMGGGLGYYFGSMIRKFGNAEVSTIKRKIATGIQVAVDCDYIIRNNLSIKAEMKFRDPQISVHNRYNQDQYSYNGNKASIIRKEFDSKINVNGVNFIFGLVFHF